MFHHLLHNRVGLVGRRRREAKGGKSVVEEALEPFVDAPSFMGWGASPFALPTSIGVGMSVALARLGTSWPSFFQVGVAMIATGDQESTKTNERVNLNPQLRETLVKQLLLNNPKLCMCNDNDHGLRVAVDAARTRTMEEVADKQPDGHGGVDRNMCFGHGLHRDARNPSGSGRQRSVRQVSRRIDSLPL